MFIGLLLLSLPFSAAFKVVGPPGAVNALLNEYNDYQFSMSPFPLSPSPSSMFLVILLIINHCTQL